MEVHRKRNWSNRSFGKLELKPLGCQRYFGHERLVTGVLLWTVFYLDFEVQSLRCSCTLDETLYEIKCKWDR